MEFDAGLQMPIEEQQQQQQQLTAFIQQQVAQQLAAMAPVAPVAPVAPASSTLKPTTPSSFSGEIGEDVAIWLWQVDKWLQAGRVQLDLEKITLATGLLRGSALAWWRTREQQPGHPIDWPSFQEELRINFQPINPVETYRDRIQTLRQTSSVLAYATAFRNIVVNIPHMTDEEKKFRFIYGLRQRTREEVRIRNPDTFEAAVQLAVRFDAIYRPGTRFFSQGYSSSEPVPMELGVISQASAIQPSSQQPRHPNGQRFSSQQPRHPNGQRFNSQHPNRLRSHTQRPNDPRDNSQDPRLKYETRQRLMKEDKCFHCQKTGHRWRECPNRK